MTPPAPRGGAAADSLFLAAVRVFSIAANLATTMVFAHRLTLESYGTYAQANLSVTVVATLTALGLADATNYFFNRASSASEASRYANSIVTMLLLLGCVAALSIVLLGPLASQGLDNPLLLSLWPYVAIRPLFTNLEPALIVLTVSVGKARAVAVRGLVFSLAKFLAALLLTYFTEDLRLLFVALISLDLLSSAWYWYVVKRSGVKLQPILLRWPIVRSVLAFSVPMAVYVTANTLSREIDKIIIATRYSADWYAVYANAAIILPLDIVPMSLLVVSIPILTRYLAGKDWAAARELFKSYLMIGYLTTIPLVLVCFLLAPDLILVLFGEKYLPGLTVFRLYLIAAIFRFASVSLVLSASGRTRTLMIISIASLVLGGALASMGQSFLGFEGPAIATVCIAALNTFVLIMFSLKEMRVKKWAEVLDWRSLIQLATSAVVVAFGFGLLYQAIIPWISPGIWRIVALAPLFTAALLLSNLNSLRRAYKAINAMSKGGY